jgi:hypothetical protein
MSLKLLQRHTTYKLHYFAVGMSLLNQQGHAAVFYLAQLGTFFRTASISEFIATCQPLLLFNSGTPTAAVLNVQ